MTDASFASLNPSLLARKGGAKPAMRPQLAPLNPNGPSVASNLEDLGWNDMGDDAEGHETSGQVLQLTPEPVNEEAEAKTHEADVAAQEALARAARPDVHRQQEELAERVAAPVAKTPAVAVATASASMSSPAKTRSKSSRSSALDRGKRAAFTLRLDAERHLKLRLACTVKGRSAQQIVTDALDKFLDDMPEIDSLAAQVQRR